MFSLFDFNLLQVFCPPPLVTLLFSGKGLISANMIRKWFQEKAMEEKKLSAVVSSEQRSKRLVTTQRVPKMSKSQSLSSKSVPFDISEDATGSPIFSPLVNISKKIFTKSSSGSSSNLRRPQGHDETEADENVVRMKILDVGDIAPDWEGIFFTLKGPNSILFYS